MDGNELKYWINFTDKEKEEWNNTVKLSSTSWLYNTEGYINHVEYYNTIASPQPNFHNLSFGVFNSKKGLLGGITLYLMSPGEITTGLSGPFYKEYNKKVEKIIFDTLDNIIINNNLSQIKIRISMLAKDYIEGKLTENYLLNYGYLYTLINSLSEVENYKLRIVNLQKDKDILYKELGQKCRNSINKAKKQNFNTIIGNSDEIIKIYSKIKTKGKEYEKRLPHGYHAIKNMVENLGSSCQIVIIELDNKPISASIYHCYKEGIFYWSNGSIGDYKNLYPNNFSMWKMIEWGHDKGFKYMDIGNYYEYELKNKKEYNVGKYKSSFGKDYIIPFYGIKKFKT